MVSNSSQIETAELFGNVFETIYPDSYPKLTDQPPLTSISTQPKSTGTNAQPKSTDTIAQPIPIDTKAQPISTDTNAQPIPIDTNAQPKSTDTNAQPIPIDTNAQPTPTDTNIQNMNYSFNPLQLASKPQNIQDKKEILELKIKSINFIQKVQKINLPLKSCINQDDITIVEGLTEAFSKQEINHIQSLFHQITDPELNRKSDDINVEHKNNQTITRQDLENNLTKLPTADLSQNVDINFISKYIYN